MDKKEAKKLAKKVWWFIWEDDSVLSWIVNIILAFVLIKFVIYPGLGLLLGTGFPVVAVVSSSMEHPQEFDIWWQQHQEFYERFEITKEYFRSFTLKNGFNKGDIIVLVGKDPQEIRIGDIIVFSSIIRSDPIIHRIIKISQDEQGYYFQTKGDNNAASMPFESHITEDKVIGKAVFRVPLLGYVKIIFMDLLELLHLV